MQVHEHNTGCETSIVFLHGANAGGWMWDRIIEQLPEFHCIAVDMPGHADSRSMEWTSPEEVAAATAKCIRIRAHDSRAHVVGLSLGGLVTLHLLDQEPEAVRKALISGVPSQRMPNQWIMRVMGAIVSPFIHNERLLQASAKAARIPDSEISEYVRQAKRNSKKAFRRINRQAVSFAPPEGALASTIAKVFITGEHDHPAIVSSLHRFTEARNAMSYKVEKLGHAWSNQNPQLFSEVVRCWIAEAPMPDSVVAITGRDLLSGSL